MSSNIDTFFGFMGQDVLVQPKTGMFFLEMGRGKYTSFQSLVIVFSITLPFWASLGYWTSWAQVVFWTNFLSFKSRRKSLHQQSAYLIAGMWATF
jgi:hypothetical protein